MSKSDSAVPAGYSAARRTLPVDQLLFQTTDQR
jgi:hypothetical protein